MSAISLRRVRNAGSGTTTRPSAPWPTASARADAMRSGCRMGTKRAVMPSALAAASPSACCPAVAGFVGFPMIATCRMPGAICARICTCLAVRSFAMFVTPVTLPPGRARVAIRPDPTGSDTAKNTIGMDEVARFAATAAGDAQARIRSTRLAASSAASAGSASKLPSAQRTSSARLLPSTWPSARSCSRTAASNSGGGALEPRKPMRVTRAGDCASVAAGAARSPLQACRRTCAGRSRIHPHGGEVQPCYARGGFAAGRSHWGCGTFPRAPRYRTRRRP